MSKTLVARTTWTNDSGTGDNGTIVGNEELQEIYDAIDDAIGQVVQVKSANYTVDVEDDLIKITSGTWTLTLFTAVGNDGKALDIVNAGSGPVTIDPNGAQTIDGASTYLLPGSQGVRIRSDGANWVIVTKKQPSPVAMAIVFG